MARPSEYSAEKHQMIVNALREGLPRAQACRIAGVTDRTLRNWLALGRADDSRPELEQFAIDIDQAEAEFAKTHVQKITRSEDWRASAWYLERRFPEFRETKNVNIEQATQALLDCVEKVCGADATEQILALFAEGGGEEEA